ncbi:uncharacterized protein LOC126906366 [Daktulosphaira vitifoliae]|uniref:uncharacterized protein LOC126906366 n=1 Tax=Daktulosphaira vitifoliae TaxID=58002 RepID=UPI0021A9B862|nr:uncharacterized protein LOC126906366 [Daktulosphaira vitifoliae]
MSENNKNSSSFIKSLAVGTALLAGSGIALYTYMNNQSTGTVSSDLSSQSSKKSTSQQSSSNNNKVESSTLSSNVTEVQNTNKYQSDTSDTPSRKLLPGWD